MKRHNYERFKQIAKMTAVIVASTIALSGCGSVVTEEEDDTDDNVYISSHGSYVPYSSYISSGGKVDSTTGFATRSADGNGYTSYNPSASEISSMKSGSFSGKVSRPTINSSSSKSSVKGFGGSSSRTSVGG